MLLSAGYRDMLHRQDSIAWRLGGLSLSHIAATLQWSDLRRSLELILQPYTNTAPTYTCFCIDAYTYSMGCAIRTCEYYTGAGVEAALTGEQGLCI